MIKRALVVLVDQAILSAVTFAMGAVFVYRGSPAEFARYSAYMSSFYLVASAQNALLSTPMMVLSSRLEHAERRAFERGLFSVLIIVALPTCVITVFTLKLIGSSANISATDALLVAVALVPLMLRDHLRAQEFANLRPEAALRRDALFGILAAVAVGFFWRAGITSVRALLALGFACTVTVLLPTARWAADAPKMNEVRVAWQRSWRHSVWSLGGAISSWTQSYAYVFIPLQFGRVNDVATLSAARLTVTPVLLASQSWGNLFRPAASQMVARSDATGLRRVFWKSTFLLALLVATYTACVAFLLPALPPKLVPSAYRGIGPSIVMWGAIVLVQVVRGNASYILQAGLEFRRLTMYGAAAAGCTILASVILVPIYGALGALGGLVAGEIVLLLALAIELRRRIGGEALAFAQHA